MVVTDMTEARRTEALLRALTHRVVQVQESERGRVALELHDNITQLLCGIVFRSEALVARLSALDKSAAKEAKSLRDLLGKVANEAERISRFLRPGVLDQLGLVAVLRATGGEFAKRTGVTLKVVCKELAARLPPETELTLFRILQEALRNVEKHARAGLVEVHLVHHGLFVQLVISDDGIGFDPARHLARRPGKGGLGLLAMRERATYVGGALTIKSVRDLGTKIAVRIPLPPQAA
jgi:signal transduction histidine kinase